jgi:hypothetical protein
MLGSVVCALSILAACRMPPVEIPTATPSAARSGLGAPPSSPQPSDIDPDKLLGQPPDAVAGLLGAPDLERREDPATVWQYRGAGCVVDLFFYPEATGATAGKAVVHLEARNAEASEVDARNCLNDMLASRRDTAF